MSCQITELNEYLNACTLIGFCIKKRFVAVRSNEVRMPGMVAAVRATVSREAASDNVTPTDFRDWLLDRLWTMKVEVVNQNMRPVDPDMDIFEPSDAIIDADQVGRFEERLRDFVRSNFYDAPSAGRVFVTSKWHAHFATTATIIGACHPDEAQWWPRIVHGEYVDPRVSNDNLHPRRNH